MTNRDTKIANENNFILKYVNYFFVGPTKLTYSSSKFVLKFFFHKVNGR